MPLPPESRTEDERASGPVIPTISETGAGIPDEAIGPAQRSVPEQLDLAGDKAAQAMAAKLQTEVDKRRGTARKAPRPVARPQP